MEFKDAARTMSVPVNLILHLTHLVLVIYVTQAREKTYCCQLVIAYTTQFRLHRCAESVRAKSA
jgi:hypothetical protein